MNGKYDCSKTLDFAHEISRMCKMGRGCEECPLNNDLGCVIDLCCDDIRNIIDEVQKWSDKIEKERPTEKIEKERPMLTENDIIMLKALQLMSFHWIIKDKNVFIPCAFITKPKKNRENGYWDSDCSEIMVNYNFSFLSWEDEEPTSIDWLLEENDGE